MKEEQSIAEFLEFARRQRDALAAQLRKETSKFQKFLDWDTTVSSIEQGMATANSSSSAFRSSPAQEVKVGFRDDFDASLLQQHWPGIRNSVCQQCPHGFEFSPCPATKWTTIGPVSRQRSHVVSHG